MHSSFQAILGISSSPWCPYKHSDRPEPERSQCRSRRRLAGPLKSATSAQQPRDVLRPPGERRPSPDVCPRPRLRGLLAALLAALLNPLRVFESAGKEYKN